MGSNLPTINVGVGRTVSKLGVGYQGTCAQLDDGTIKCWGSNTDGRLGLDSTTSKTSPSDAVGAVSGLALVGRDIWSGYNYNCSVLMNNSVKCWGSNSNGELGFDSTQNWGGTTSSAGSILYLPKVSLGSMVTSAKATINVRTSSAAGATIQIPGTDPSWSYDWSQQSVVSGDYVSFSDRYVQAPTVTANGAGMYVLSCVIIASSGDPVTVYFTYTQTAGQ